MNNLKLFGKRVQELRKQKKFTQEQLGEIVGIDYKQIGNIETGTYFTTMSTLEKIAEALNCEIMELFNYNHLKEKNELIDEIRLMLSNATEDKVKILYRITKDVLK